MHSLQFTWLQEGERRHGAQPLLSVRSLNVRIGVRRVLNGLDLDVYPGDHIRITGPNGSGKSTLLNAIAGVEPANVESGSIAFNGKQITSHPAYIRAGWGISYMRQTDNVFPSLTVSENLIMSLGKKGPNQFIDSFPNWSKQLPLHRPAGLLSGGQKKKLAWAMAILRNHDLLLADEPDAGSAEPFAPPVASTYIVVSHD
ncbi:MAG: ATP-binding cassette domain-containing protein [Nitrososphaera sp.]|nr:ATP-binding cassette domain-containing protein [Nitrososphaera sp.]